MKKMNKNRIEFNWDRI